MTTRRSAGARAAAALGATMLFFLFAAPASAAVPPLPGPVQDTVDKVDDIVSSDDPVGDAVDAVDDAIGGATGTDDPIQGTIDDVTDTGEEVADDVSDTVDDVRGTVDGTVDDVTDTVRDTVDTVDEATGGVIGGVVGGGNNGAPDGNAGGRGPRSRAFGPRATTRSDRNARNPNPDGRRGTSARDRAATRTTSIDGGDAGAIDAETIPAAPEAGLGERLREAALEATKKLALPLALTVVVLGYLIAQYWADRKDPKLVFAPIDADHDLLSFQ